MFHSRLGRAVVGDVVGSEVTGDKVGCENVGVLLVGKRDGLRVCEGGMGEKLGKEEGLPLGRDVVGVILG